MVKMKTSTCSVVSKGTVAIKCIRCSAIFFCDCIQGKQDSHKIIILLVSGLWVLGTTCLSIIHNFLKCRHNMDCWIHGRFSCRYSFKVKIISTLKVSWRCSEILWDTHCWVLGVVSIIYGIHIFLFTDWLKVHHVIKNKLTVFCRNNLKSHKKSF